jgi:hypothetical protein
MVGRSRRCRLVSYRMYVTGPTPFGVRGDVCPDPATIGTKLRHLRSTTAVGVAVSDGGQDGRQTFAVDRREVPT